MSSSESDKEQKKYTETLKLKDLVKKRGVIKARLTLFKKHITEIDKESVTAEQLIELDLRINKIASVFTEFEIIQEKIETLSSDLETHLAERDLFENSYYKYVSLGKGILGQTRSNDSQQPSCANNHVPEHTEAIKFPDISLPIFRGDITEWIEFRDTFDALINQSSLKPIQKYKYLRSCLADSALEVVSSLEYSEESYTIAWQLLCERYNNPKVLIFNHLRALFNIDVIVSNPIALRKVSDNISKHLRTLRTLNVSTNDWDLLVIFFLSSKLDKSLQRRWEEKTNSRELPKLQDFKHFLRSQADLMESLGVSLSADAQATQPGNALVATSSSTPTVPKVRSNFNQIQCPNCKERHYINQCPKFLTLNPTVRIRVVRRLNLCSNCLSGTHILPNCRATTCRTCKGKHHTLLHTTQPPHQSTLYHAGASEPESTKSVNLYTNKQVANATMSQTDGKLPKTVILSTAQIDVRDNNNQLHTLRVLLDSGSQSNFITQSAFNKLGLPTHEVNMEVLGFNESSTKANRLCDLSIQSRDKSFTTKLSCFIVPNICNMPSIVTNVQDLAIPSRFRLADESFHQGGEIDMLLGAEQFYSLLCVGQHRLGNDRPILQKTRLGWVVSGPVDQPISKSVRCNFTKNLNINFWNIDECLPTEIPDDDITQCEKVFDTHTRTSDGKFVVSIPLNSQPNSLGKSKNLAFKRFKSLESKFTRDPEYKEKYVEFIRDFQDAGHMIKTNSTEACNYLPHHAVLTPQKTTTPLRVVFDASAPTSSGKSLNDIQLKGTIQQDDLTNIILRFRKNKYVISADIEKMYRMIYLNPEQQNLQCILWRENTTDLISTYILTTLSFGLKCAPYIATRCLRQLAIENKTDFPVASKAILEDFYMDDLLHGGDDEQLVAQTATQIESILLQANFKLRKWKSNSENIISAIENGSPSRSNITLTSFDTHNTHKILGLAWCNETDCLLYVIKNTPMPNPITKRKVLSIASAIFDPLGLLAPVLITAKVFIQKLWKLKIDWDEALPNELIDEWQCFYKNISLLNQLVIPRHTAIDNYITIELHGFSDSSLTAYGAAIFMRTYDKQGNICVRLLCAKSRVARQETIPRLELRGALLLAQLMDKVFKALNFDNNVKKWLWSDSNVALAWIRSQPHKQNCFVRNRIIEIQNLTDTQDWRWVKSSENPADLLSRGISADKLAECTLWWGGPSWLAKPIANWPTQHNQTNDLPNLALDTLCNIVIDTKPNKFMTDLCNKWSNLRKLNRVFAFMLRFIHNAKNPTNRIVGSLTVTELNESRNKLIQYSQIESFPREYNQLKNNKPILQSSNLSSLNPIFENGLIRVGGRLGLSKYSHDKKHPIILPQHHTLTKLIIQNEHIRLLHAGPQLLLSSLRERYWPVHGRRLVAKIFNKCVICFKAKPKFPSPIMGNLPSSRVNPSPPFHATNVDFCGPYFLRDTRRGRRGCIKSYKGYVAIFVCNSTKAVHIELVSSLETSAFLAAYRRFIARRGRPKEMLSDNGTTFHGANNEITELYDFFRNHSDELATACADDGIMWKFNLAYSPHMVSLHESAVRLCKFYLVRTLGKALLTYEEFATILTQVEGILNSRPLCPLPSSVNDDFTFLTPAHFLIGRSPISLPDYDYMDVPNNRLTYYQQLQRLRQDFWRQWSRDYCKKGRSGEAPRDQDLMLEPWHW